MLQSKHALPQGRRGIIPTPDNFSTTYHCFSHSVKSGSAEVKLYDPFGKILQDSMTKEKTKHLLLSNNCSLINQALRLHCSYCQQVYFLGSTSRCLVVWPLLCYVQLCALYMFCRTRSCLALLYFMNTACHYTESGPKQMENQSIKGQQTQFSFNSCDLIGNMMLTLVCSDHFCTFAEHQPGFIFLEFYQKGAAKANSNEPHWRSLHRHHFNRFLNEDRF